MGSTLKDPGSLMRKLSLRAINDILPTFDNIAQFSRSLCFKPQEEITAQVAIFTLIVNQLELSRQVNYTIEGVSCWFVGTFTRLTSLRSAPHRLRSWV